MKFFQYEKHPRGNLLQNILPKIYKPGYFKPNSKLLVINSLLRLIEIYRRLYVPYSASEKTPYTEHLINEMQLFPLLGFQERNLSGLTTTNVKQAIENAEQTDKSADKTDEKPVDKSGGKKPSNVDLSVGKPNFTVGKSLDFTSGKPDGFIPGFDTIGGKEFDKIMADVKLDLPESVLQSWEDIDNLINLTTIGSGILGGYNKFRHKQHQQHQPHQSPHQNQPHQPAGINVIGNAILKNDFKILTKFLPNTNHILIGDYAIDYTLGKTPNIEHSAEIETDIPRRLQIITDMELEHLISAVGKILEVSLSYQEHTVNLPQDFQLTKHTIYAKTLQGGLISVMDVFNSVSYELLPYKLQGGIKLGNICVLIRFKLIDMWSQHIISSFKNNEMLQQLMARIETQIVDLREKFYVMLEKPETIFQIANYAGKFQDEKISKKQIREENDKKFTQQYFVKTVLNNICKI